MLSLFLFLLLYLAFNYFCPSARLQTYGYNLSLDDIEYGNGIWFGIYEKSSPVDDFNDFLDEFREKQLIRNRLIFDASFFNL